MAGAFSPGRFHSAAFSLDIDETLTPNALTCAATIVAALTIGVSLAVPSTVGAFTPAYAAPAFAVEQAIAGTASASIAFGNDRAFFTADVAAGATVSAALRAGANLSAAVSAAADVTALLTASERGQATVLIAGVDRTAKVHLGSITISDRLNDAPNECTFTTLDGYQPAEHQDLTITLDTGTRLFGGVITKVEQLTEDVEDLLVWHVSCLDYTYLLQRRYPLGRYTNVSASTIVTDLITRFSSGFTTAGVVAGLPSLSMDFDGSADLPSCLTRVTQEIGAYWRPDYFRDVAAFLEDTAVPPDPIIDSNLVVRDIRRDGDATQVRTRVCGAGAGGSVETGSREIDVPLGSTTIPLNRQTPFSSGLCLVGPQVLSYTGVSADAGHGTESAGIPQVPGTPSVAVYTGGLTDTNGKAIPVAGRVPAGVLGYKVAYVNDEGDESELGAIAAVSLPVVPTPNTPMAAVYTGGAVDDNGKAIPVAGAMEAGTRSVVVSFVTATGETLPSAAAAVTIATIAAASGPAAAPISGVAGNLRYRAGQGYFYKIGFLTANGETLPGGSSASASITQVTAPASLPTLAATTGGSLTPSTLYYYNVVFVDAAGETGFVVEVGVGLSASDTAVQLTNLPVSTDGRVTARRIYRRVSGLPRLVTTIGDNTTTAFKDTVADASLGAEQPVTGNTTGTGKIRLTSLATSSDPRVVGRSIYRTPLIGGGVSATWYQIGTIRDTVTTTFDDDTPDASLSQAAPTVSTADNGRVSLTSIPVSSDPRVTERKIYLTKSGGTVYGLAASIGNNTATAWLLNVSDDSLGEPPPKASTADNGRIRLTGLPLGPTVPLGVTTISPTASRRIYRTVANGSTFFRLRSIADNVTTELLDNSDDDALGEEAPPFSHWRTLKGASSLPIKDVVQITDAPGWIKAGSQVVRFTGVVGTSGGRGLLTGIPPSGAGAIQADLTVDQEIVGLPFLKGVPATGTGSILYPLKQGDTVAIYVQRDDLAAQAALAAIEGGDGVHEDYFSDSSIASVTALTQACDAKVALFKVKLSTLSYGTRDVKSGSGKSVVINRTALGLSGTYKIQEVTITEIGTARRLDPLFTVKASSVKFTLEDLLRRALGPRALR